MPLDKKKYSKDIYVEKEKITFTFESNPSLLSPPTLSDYNISEEDVKNYDDYYSEGTRYEYKFKKIQDNVFWGLTIFVWLMFIPLWITCEALDFQPMSSNYTALEKAIVVILIFLLMTLYMPGGCWIWVKNPLIGLLIHRHVSKKYRRVIPGPNRSQVLKYYNAVDHHCSRLRYFKGVEHYNYDLKRWLSEDVIPSFLQTIRDYAEEQNKRTYNALKWEKQSYWYNLNPYEFEKEVAQWFTDKGYQASVTSKSGDGGVDIILTNENKEKFYVQCKRYCTQKVDRPTLQQLYGVVCADFIEGAKGGIIVCLCGLSPAAQEFADRVNIKVYTIDDLSPQPDLFNHMPKNELLRLSVETNSGLCRYKTDPCNIIKSYRIGNITVSGQCFTSEEHIEDSIDSLFPCHIVEHKKIYFIASCWGRELNAIFKNTRPLISNEIQYDSEVYVTGLKMLHDRINHATLFDE